MAGEDIIMASQKELKRLYVIRKVMEKVIRQVKAAEILFLSVRQIRRLVQQVRMEGDRGVVHKSRGRLSNRRMADGVKEKVIKVYRERYKGFGPTLASEKLWERQRVRVSDETLRKWLIGSGDWKKVHKKGVHRQWRERKEHYGEMVQVDGSHHDWLEGRGPWCVLMGYIDDATGKGFGRFYAYEGTIPAMDSFRGYIERYGVPLSVYVDRQVSGAGELPPCALSEPDMNLSAHPAPIIQPWVLRPPANAEIARAASWLFSLTNIPPW